MLKKFAKKCVSGPKIFLGLLRVLATILILSIKKKRTRIIFKKIIRNVSICFTNFEVFFKALRAFSRYLNDDNVTDNSKSLEFFDFLFSNLSKSYSGDFQDIFVLWLFNGQLNQLGFIEIGADDGIRKSNCLLIESLGAKGVIIEANPLRQEELKKNRKSKIINRALVSKSKKMDKVILRVPALSMSFSTIEMTPFLADIAEHTNDLEVPTVQFDQVLKTYLLKFQTLKFSYLSLDIEGNEEEILKDVFECNYYPSVISIEHNFIPDKSFKIQRLFHEHDYSIVMPSFFRNDYVAVLNSVHKSKSL